MHGSMSVMSSREGAQPAEAAADEVQGSSHGQAGFTSGMTSAGGPRTHCQVVHRAEDCSDREK